MDQRSNLIVTTVKLLKENIMENFKTIAFGNDFLDVTSKAQATKEKQTGLDQNEKFWYIKGCHEHKNETTHRMGEYICKSHIE